MKNNLLHQHLIKAHFPANRCTGLSTGIALRAIGDAMQNPEMRCYIQDHARYSTNNNNSKPDQFTSDLAQACVGKLGLVGFTFGHDHKGYYVVYDLNAK